ncbi:hypothetical protein LV83_02779 [Algoriphagus yeomjeoni]|uniref:Uncharacterized protein n=1 Tax=Algoriphagus yeomjeoni TaxID=291403 RepID=A0A327P8B5_9BACT|nr:hypothetical protein LV83_02779 [Algoriphagus yeomjeoni]
MGGGFNDRTLTGINFIIVGYFIFLWLANYFQLDFFIIGFFVELLTIPFLFAQLVFLFIGVKFILQNERPALLMVSLVALALCTIITIGRFIW